MACHGVGPCHLLYWEEQGHGVVLQLDVGRLGAGHLDLPHHEPACHNEDVHDVGILNVEGVRVVVGVYDVGQGLDVEGLLESSRPDRMSVPRRTTHGIGHHVHTDRASEAASQGVDGEDIAKVLTAARLTSHHIVETPRHSLRPDTLCEQETHSGRRQPASQVFDPPDGNTGHGLAWDVKPWPISFDAI